MTRPARRTYLHGTLAWCAHCGATEPARVVAAEDGVFLERICPSGSIPSVKIAADPAWYRERTSGPGEESESFGTREPRLGCPRDCGPCRWHAGGLHLAVFSVTNRCNLDCPKCFTYNRGDLPYDQAPAETRQIVAQVAARGQLQLVNLTGGEPTLHPDLFGVIDACRHPLIGRITVNTNGLRLAEDPALARRLKESGVQVVLSLDTLDPATSVVVHGRDITGEKRRALSRLEEHDIPTTILSVCIKGVNEAEVGRLAREFLPRDFVRSVTVQNMTFTGNNGSRFLPREHVTMDEVERLLGAETPLSPEHFFRHASYHPLCYSLAYYVSCEGRLLSLTELLPAETLTALSRGRYFLEPSRSIARDFLEGVNRLWAEGGDPVLLRGLRRLVDALHPGGREADGEEARRVLERHVKMVCVHPHMDEDNFDVDRVSRCGDLVPDADGRMIPACSYNLLYRQQDPRFWVGPS